MQPCNKKMKVSDDKSTSVVSSSADYHWLHQAADEIDRANTVQEIAAIRTHLERLLQQAEAQLCSIKEKSQDFRDTGCMVKLVESNESQDQDLGFNMCARQVWAKFTAGPRKAPFHLNIEVKDWEGEEEINIDSNLFDLCKESSDDDDMKDCFGMPTAEEITEFCLAAGMGLCPITQSYQSSATRTTTTDDDDNENKAQLLLRRQTFAYAEIVNEAFELLGEKYGWEDSCGVGLGIGNEEIYELMGLDY